MLNICQLENLTTQLDNTSLAQPVTKQCFMLFSVCKDSTGSHCMNNFGVLLV